MTTMRRVFAVIAGLALAACAAPPPPADSGITGQALVGPMCPVMIEGQECPDQPYQATVTVLGQNGREVTRFQTDAQGRFTVNLAPGTYTLRPESPEGMPLPAAGEQSVTVVAGQFTQVTILYDSGIR